MYPLPSARLKRRMNELERALISTVVILAVLLVVLFLSGVLFQIDDLQPNHQFIPDPAKPIRIARKRVNEYDTFPYFLPGTLAWNRTDTLHHCQVDHLFVGNKRLPQTQGCSKSEKYRLIFHLTPKSGSSTGRHVVKHDFEGVDYHHERDCHIPQEGDSEEWLSMAVLRNPATRAFASYEEMFVRKLGNPDAIPSTTRRFMEPFRGWIYPNYSALFDTTDGVRKLNLAYEQFMEDWDGKAFEMHLESQVAYNVRRHAVDGKISSNHLNLVFDTHSMEQSFAYVAARVGLSKTPKVIRGRAYPRRLNVSQVSDSAMQAMCRHYKEDFCCLNYVLPSACLRASQANTRVRCKWAAEESKIQAVIV